LLKPLENLAPRRALFCLHYAQSGNRTEAAIRAGYSERSAYNQGHRLMKNDEIAKAISSLMENAVTKEQITPDFIVKALVKEAMTSETDGNRTRALELLGKWRKMFVDVHEEQTPERQMTPEQLRETLLEAIEADPDLQHAVISRLMDSGALAKHHGQTQQEGGTA